MTEQLLVRFSEGVLDKAHRYRAEGRVAPASRDDDNTSTWVVRGSSGDYVVTIAGDHTHATCTCAHGRHREGAPATCSHVAACLLEARGE